MSCIECWKYKTCPYRLNFNMSEEVGCIYFEKEKPYNTVANTLNKGDSKDE